MKKTAGISMIATSLLIVCGLLLAASPARADEDDAKCTNRSLRGEFGYQADGALLGVPGLPPAALFNSVGLAHFDGKGHLSWVEHTIVNGRPLNVDFVAAKGTYNVNADCTGTAVVNTPNSPVPLNLFFVLVKGGKEIRTVLDGSSITSVFVKIE
jgi:hypothetical protein